MESNNGGAEMKEHKRDIIVIGIASVVTFLAGGIYSSSSIHTRERTLGTLAAATLSDTFPFWRQQELITSYFDESRNVRFHLINDRSNTQYLGARFYNTELNVDYLFLHRATYPSGKYNIEITPQNNSTHKTAVLTRTFSDSGNHIVRYRFADLIQKRSSNLVASNKSQFDFELNLDTIGGIPDALDARNSNTSIEHISYQTPPRHTENWQSGPVYINSSPRDAHIEILHPVGMTYTPGMRFNTQSVKIKVTSPNYIFSKRWLTLSEGKNIFVAPLQRY